MNKELRIGNLIQQGEITMLSNNSVWIGDDIFLTDEIEPIPLTEEWLLKFGFNYVSPFGYRIKQGCFIKDDLETNGYYFRWNGKTLSLLHYVHQLQNLYFALTNEELIFKN